MADCIFCQIPEKDWIYQTDKFYLVWDIDPIQEGHMILISKEHRLSLLDLTDEEGRDLLALQKKVIATVESLPDWGVTVAINNGHLMDQGTHFHCHLIPRYKGDGFWDKVHVEKKGFMTKAFLNALL